jgi:hypothetical protein
MTDKVISAVFTQEDLNEILTAYRTLVHHADIRASLPWKEPDKSDLHAHAVYRLKINNFVQALDHAKTVLDKLERKRVIV